MTTTIDLTVRSALLSVVGAETLVPLTDGRQLPYANLDAAASAPALNTVAERVANVLPYYASVHRGAGYLSQVCTTLYEQARAQIGAFVGARDDDHTIIVRNTTDALNLLAGITKGKVLVLDVEHHANLLPWSHHGRSGAVLGGGVTVAATLQALAQALDSDAYDLLALTGASNVTGESLPLDQVIELAHSRGVRVAVDGAQLVPHRGFSLAETDADYVAFSGHKTYAPFGAGALVGRADWLDAGSAYLAGGGAVRNVQVDKTSWETGPARHEAGSPNVLGAVALAQACLDLDALRPGALAEHERELREQLVDGLSALPGVKVARIWPDSDEPVGVVTFGIEEHNPGFVAAYLSAEHGIGVRDGRFCAHPLLARLGLPHGAVRASICVGTTSEHIDRLIEGVRILITDGPSAQYEVIDGGWAVANDLRPLPHVPGLDHLEPTAWAKCGLPDSEEA